MTEKFVEKYRAKKIKSVIHFRRIMEAYDVAEEAGAGPAVVERLNEYITDVELETRRAFDEFVTDTRRVQTAVKACDEFVGRLQRAKVEHALDREEITEALKTGRLERLLRGT